MRVRVLRAFCLGGTRQEPQSAIDVADHIGRDLIALGKAERIAGAKPAARPGPMTTETVAPVVSGKTKAAEKGAKDV